ncbi:hypothetical protein ACSBLW_00150 [Thioclava sp. FR2]|uniref:hypothetical protein n=1 Tax=Thioclava sp. FR2 TaxID=3445780 RepID=UPI003EB8C07B
MPKLDGAGGGNGKTTSPPPPEGAVVGTDLADFLAGTGADEIIWGLGGDDELLGSGGNDSIEGGAGNDTIDGGDGDDILNGGDGGDLFIGSAGSDTIDGGAGVNAVIYYAENLSDYTITAITATVTRGKKVTEEIVGYEVTKNDGSGDVDYITNVSSVTVVVIPPPGAITTQGDFTFVPYDSTVTINVLENDYLEGGNLGEGLTVTAITDIQLDLDGDGHWDTNLIDETLAFEDYANGVLLLDGSILTVTADGTMTWDPNGVYDMNPGETPAISFWYEASNGSSTEYGDVTFAVSYPPPVGDIDFETMTPALSPLSEAWLGYNYYYDGPDGSYIVSQLSSATGWFEVRDVAAGGDFDYDSDGDDEFRVWTEANGTTHEMNITHATGEAFDLGGMTIIGLDEGEVVIFTFADASGNAIGSVTVTAADLNADGVVEFTNASNVQQFTVEAGAGDEFYIDDIYFL